MITIENNHYDIRIKFNGILHVHIPKAKYLGLQSWRDGDNNFSIEYHLIGGNIICEYDTIEKWTFILDELDKIGNWIK